MGAYDYIVVLLSFVYALALAHLLTSVTELVRARSRVHFSWPHALWMANALVLLFLNWLQQYDNHAIHKWGVGAASFAFLFAIVEYFTCSFVSPPTPEHGEIDLQAFHDREKAWYLGATAVLGLLALRANWVEWRATGASLDSFVAQQVSILPALVFTIVPIFTRRRWVDIACAAAMFALVVWFAAVFTGELR